MPPIMPNDEGPFSAGNRGFDSGDEDDAGVMTGDMGLGVVGIPVSVASSLTCMIPKADCLGAESVLPMFPAPF